MQNLYWNVLVVDDEEDVIAVTTLALKRLTIYGLPVKLHSVHSKAEAIDWFEKNPESKALHVALIDVVMESDTAGLELCDVIRRQQRNVLTRIVLRTGQAGKAPEREVVDRYDITQYLGKTEATEDKLYSVVKCCMKEWYASSMLSRVGMVTGFLAPHTQTPEAFKKRVKELFFSYAHDAHGRPIPSLDPSYCQLWGEDDDHVGTGIFEDRKHAIEIRDRLLDAPKESKTVLNEAGDMLINHPDPAGRALNPPRNTTLFVCAASSDGTLPRQCTMWETANWPIPDFAISAAHSLFLAYRPLYLLAKMRGKAVG